MFMTWALQCSRLATGSNPSISFAIQYGIVSIVIVYREVANFSAEAVLVDNFQESLGLQFVIGPKYWVVTCAHF
jgi:hypothetical protein